jgi:hypothetical protein
MAVLNKKALKDKIDSVITTNAAGAITATILNDLLKDISDSFDQINVGKNQIPLLIGFGQSNATIDRGPTLPTNDRSYTEEASNLIVVPNEITVTNSNSGGSWNGSTSSLRMLHNRWKASTNKLGWQIGVDRALDFYSFKKVLFVEASSGGKPVDYFHPGGGVRITTKGAGWTDLSNKLQTAYSWAETYGFELVPFGVFTWQGESDAATRGTNQNDADLWMEDWAEIHDELKSLLDVSFLPHNFMQIFHETPATMTLRDRLNLSMKNKSDIDDEYNYIELLSASDISNQDPNELTQDMEHWGYKGYFKAGILATKYFFENYQPEKITLNIPSYQKPDFSLVSPKAVIEVVSGAFVVTGTLGITQNNTINFASGDINTGGEIAQFINPESGLITDFTPVFATGFSWAMRFRITASTSKNHILSGDGNGMYCLSNDTGDPQDVRVLSDTSNSFGINVQDLVWRTLGCTLLANGNVQLFVDGVKVREGAITSALLGQFSVFTWGSNPSLGAIGEMSWCLFHDSPLSEAEMITLTS